jgi:hypothetical protein
MHVYTHTWNPWGIEIHFWRRVGEADTFGHLFSFISPIILQFKSRKWQHCKAYINSQRLTFEPMIFCSRGRCDNHKTTPPRQFSAIRRPVDFVYFIVDNTSRQSHAVLILSWLVIHFPVYIYVAFFNQQIKCASFGGSGGWKWKKLYRYMHVCM